ncbi:PTS glucose transporter subunit IIA [Flavimobilis marinus]|uniref:PTS system N-acetylglucosamine-specific IIA component, Glc family n=1 Tax=Flavimobilis marinus TaxID=285351 RepID=A0A1I2DY86_9MICO|nr:PTS glucose transporter subunit IIA [Flavimobilis marinus]GHG44084.1 PTS glucose transporter subunit IIA [Flavimobilis marinus]SFE85203.1 PTS system N-acetylglucosamine-specific IIA component, Glc family [Flavimobilis marinus]
MRAPFRGVVLPLAAVPDPVFAGEMVGPGLALRPEPGVHVVCAPVAGVVASLFPHACAISAPGDRTVVLHLGIDTVGLKGVGFETIVAVGDVVDTGAVLLRWDTAPTLAAGLSTVSPVVALQAEAGIRLVAEPDDVVAPGDLLLTWA